MNSKTCFESGDGFLSIVLPIIVLRTEPVSCKFYANPATLVRVE